MTVDEAWSFEGVIAVVKSVRRAGKEDAVRVVGSVVFQTGELDEHVLEGLTNLEKAEQVLCTITDGSKGGLELKGILDKCQTVRRDHEDGTRLSTGLRFIMEHGLEKVSRSLAILQAKPKVGVTFAPTQGTLLLDKKGGTKAEEF